MQGFGKLVLAATFVVAGWFSYKYCFKEPSRAFLAYSDFANALADQDFETASEYTDGAALRYVDAQRARLETPVLEVMGQRAFVPKVEEIAGQIAWIKRSILSERELSPTQVKLSVKQIVCRIPPGVASAICKWPVEYRHEVELELQEGEWWVTQFTQQQVN